MPQDTIYASTMLTVRARTLATGRVTTDVVTLPPRTLRAKGARTIQALSRLHFLVWEFRPFPFTSLAFLKKSRRCVPTYRRFPLTSRCHCSVDRLESLFFEAGSFSSLLSTQSSHQSKWQPLHKVPTNYLYGSLWLQRQEQMVHRLAPIFTWLPPISCRNASLFYPSRHSHLAS